MVLILLFTGCGSRQISTSDLFNANLTAKLLETQEGIRLTFNGYGFTNELFLSKDAVYLEYEKESYLIESEDNWVYDRESDMLAYMWYAMSDEERKENRMKQEEYGIIGSDILMETVAQIEDNGDQTISIIIAPGKENSEQLLRDSYEDLPKEYYSYELKSVYTVDADTRMLLSDKDILVSDSGDILLGEGNVEYNGEKPALMQKMQERIRVFKEREQNPATKKIITVIYDARTEREESFVRIVDKECFIAPIIREGYVSDNETVTDADGTVHVTLKAVKSEKEE